MARQRLKELTPSIDSVKNWNFAYLDMLKELAGKKIPDLADVEIKGQGLDSLERSRTEHAVAVELKNFAIAFLGPDISGELEKLPESCSLDDFLKRAMPNTGKQVLRDRFVRFLTARAESMVDEQMELHPKPGVSRENYAKRTAQVTFEIFNKSGLAAPTHLEYRNLFLAWWKASEGNNLAGDNDEARMRVENRHQEMIKLLPSRNNQQGKTKEDWKSDCKKSGFFSSVRTFNRDVKDLATNNLVQTQADGRFRQIPQKK